MSAKNLNDLYAVYKLSSGVQRDQALQKLVKALFRDANAIVWHKLRASQPHIVADSVSQAVTYLDNFREESKFSTWFYQIVVNHCASNLRQKKQRSEISLEQYREENGDIKAPDRKDSSSELKTLVASLTSLDRKVVTLKAEGFTHKEIATKLKLTKKAVDQRWARVKERLSEKGEVPQDTSSDTTAVSAASVSGVRSNERITRRTARSEYDRDEVKKLERESDIERGNRFTPYTVENCKK